MIYIGDRGHNPAGYASINQGALDLLDGACYGHAAIAVKLPEGVGIPSKFVPAPDAPFGCEFIYILPKAFSNIACIG